MKKRLLSAILILILCISAVPFAHALQSPDFGISERKVTNNPVSGLKSASVTDKYYFDSSMHTPSQNQKSTSACWAFVQNELIAANVSKKTGIKGADLNFSEQTMKFETSYLGDYEWGYYRQPNDGGNEFISTAYLARKGSVYEKDEPFDESETRTADPDTLERHGYLKNTFMYSYGVYDPDSPALSPERKQQMADDKAAAIQKTKELVLEYGAVGTGMYYEATSTYENSLKTTYNYTGNSLNSNHSVTIVGWDDECPAESFTKVPRDLEGNPLNGAFIVKNSWGNYHNQKKVSYVKVSYYDKHITSQFFVTDYELENDVYDNVYQYDGYGWAQNGYAEDSTVLCITKFNANKLSEKLSGVSTYVTDGGTQLEVMVNVGGDMNDPLAYKTVATQYCEDAGYYFFDFEPIALKHSEYYVAFRHTTGNERTYFPIQNNVSGLIISAENIPDTCYVGTTFDNTQAIERVIRNQNVMLCMKAYTQSTEDTTPPSGRVFYDVPTDKWFSDPVEYCVSHGIFSGMSDTHFEPQTAMTRAMFVKVLSNMSGEELWTSDSPFTDVKQNKWYTEAVSWAYKNGIVSGITETTFAPDQKITREQMCFMLIKFAQYKGITLRKLSVQKNFTDAHLIRPYAKQAVADCQMAGIVNGMTDGSFAPTKSATRAEVSVLLSSLAKNYIY